MSNPADNKIAVVKELVKGQTPANPAFQYADVVNGGATLTYDMKELSSETMNQTRDMAGIRKVAGSGAGSLKFEFRADPVITAFMAGGFSGVVDDNGVCKGSNVDTSFSIHEMMTHDGATFGYLHKNRQVAKTTITVDAEGKAQITFDYVGGGRELVKTTITGATYASTEKGRELVGIDVGTINIAGFTARYISLTITIEQSREAEFALGERDAVGVSTNSPRVVTVEAKALRKDLSAEDLFEIDDPVAVEIELGDAGNGYGFDFPAMVGGVPKNEINSTKQVVTLTLKAQKDAVKGYGAAFKVL